MDTNRRSNQRSTQRANRLHLAEVPALDRGQAVAATVLGALLVLTSTLRLTASTWLPDELLYARTGAAYVAGDLGQNLEHPPLAKFLFGLGQQLTGSEVVGTRLVGALASVAIGVLLFALLRRIAGNVVALVGLGLWAVLPHTGGMSGPLAEAGRLDRFGMLDPVATALAMGALLLGWNFLQRPHWLSAVLTGLVGGLAAAAKPTGVLVLPAFALLALWWHRDEAGEMVASIVLAALASVAGFALAYAPFGTAAPDAVRQLVDFQLQHAADGHVVTVAGETTAFPPWWSHLHFHVRDDGWLLSLVLLGALVAAPLLARAHRWRLRQGTTYLVVAVAAIAVPLSLASVKLPFYRYAWTPLLVGLVAIALVLAAADERLPVRIGGGVAALVVLVSGIGQVVGTVRLQPTDYQVAADRLAEAGLADGPVLLVGRERILRAYAPDVRLVDEVATARAVVLDDSITSRFPRPDVADAVAGPGWDCVVSAGVTTCLLR